MVSWFDQHENKIEWTSGKTWFNILEKSLHQKQKQKKEMQDSQNPGKKSQRHFGSL